MRVSVLTGLLACALVFVATPQSAQAASTKELLKNFSSDEPLVVAVVDREEPLVEVVEKLDIATEQAAQTAAVPEVKKHVIAKNETLTEIAKTYQTTWNRLFDKNTAIEDPNVIVPGMEIIIPEATEELPTRPLPVVEQPAPVAAAAPRQSAPKKTVAAQPVATTTAARGSSDGNRYVAGYCTWYVKNKRPDMPNNLGNAATWVSRAAAQGMATGSSPQVGAVGQRGNHVVFVESVNADGTVTISEMNHTGLYQITTRTLPASYFSYIY